MSETGARLVGEGGPANRQAGPRERLRGSRRRSRGRKIHCKARGARGRRCAVAMRGVWILPEYVKWKKGTDGGGAGGKEKKRRRRGGALALYRGN